MNNNIYDYFLSIFNYCYKLKNKKLNRKKYFSSHYELIELLQTNKYIDVIKVKCKKDKKIYVLKILSINYDINEENYEVFLQNEYNNLKNIEHNNIIKPINYIPNFGIKLDYIKSNELYILLKNNELNINNKINIFNKLIDAIKYLHNKSIYHLDIKIENILITNDYEPFLIDFGTSTNNKISTILNGGTHVYLPPENKNSYYINSPKYDSWCLGLIILSFLNIDLFYLWLNNKQSYNLYHYIVKKINNGPFSHFNESFNKLFSWDEEGRYYIKDISIIQT
jgi:serine/threonine protein kinase